MDSNEVSKSIRDRSRLFWGLNCDFELSHLCRDVSPSSLGKFNEMLLWLWSFSWFSTSWLELEFSGLSRDPAVLLKPEVLADSGTGVSFTQMAGSCNNFSTLRSGSSKKNTFLFFLKRKTWFRNYYICLDTQPSMQDVSQIGCKLTLAEIQSWMYTKMYTVNVWIWN